MDTNLAPPSASPAETRKQLGAWLAGRSLSSRRHYASGIERTARVLCRQVEEVDWVRLEPAAVELVREELVAQGRSPSTVNLTLAAVRSLVRHLWRAGLVSHEQLARLEDVGGARGSRLPTGRHVEQHELAAIAKACSRDGSLIALRDVALVGLAATTGMRRAEIASLRIEDLDAETGRLVVRGKGNKQRAVFVTNDALEAFRDWIAARGPQPGHLFLRLVRKPGRTHELTGDSLSTQAVADVLTRRAAQAGIDPVRPHDLRRTVAGELLDAGTDIATVARLLGHADVRTTARYDRRPDHAVAAPAAKIRFPYQHVAMNQTTALEEDLASDVAALRLRPQHFLQRSLRQFSENGRRAMLHFLGLRHLGIPGYDAMLEHFVTKAIWSPSTNRGYLAWTDALSEVSAIYLLSTMGLELLGIEQLSPRRRAPRKRCDLVAGYPGGEPIYFEVKHRGTEDAQWIPEDVFLELRKLKYPATPQLVRYRHEGRIFDCDKHLPQLIGRTREYIKEFDRLKARAVVEHQAVPSSVDLGDIELTFHSDARRRDSTLRHIDPIWAGEVENWLFEQGNLGRDGKPMVPMVDAAIEKGADYLICEVGSFCLYDIPHQCFPGFEEMSEGVLLAPGDRMFSLAGILAFATRSLTHRLLFVNRAVVRQPLSHAALGDRAQPEVQGPVGSPRRQR